MLGVKIPRPTTTSMTNGPMPVSDPKGSGFIWSQDGVIVTNYHVIDFVHQNGDPGDIGVDFFNGDYMRAHVLAFSKHKDIAILKLNGRIPNLTPIRASGVSVRDLLVGQQVIVVGHLYGLGQSLTVGVISGLNVEISNNGFPMQGCIQVDCTTNPGNSGGPLLDSMGRLIGMHTARLSLPNNGFSGIGFSISIDTICRVVRQLLQTGRIPIPNLGVIMNEITGEDGDLILPLGSTAGLVVVDAPPLSAGGRAGLSSVSSNIYDIIRAVDERPVFTSMDLYRICDRHDVGDTVMVDIWRYMSDEAPTPLRIQVTLQDEVEPDIPFFDI